MFLKSIIALAMVASILGAAESSNSDVFAVRSFLLPMEKGKRYSFPEMFSQAPEPLAERGKSTTCSIPLREFKVQGAQKADPVAKGAGPGRDPIAKAPPVPVCKGWN